MLRVVFVAVVGVVVVGGAGCGVSPEQSKKLWTSIESSLGHPSGSTRQQALSVGLDFNVDCAEGGTASLKANLDVTGSNTGVDSALNALFGYDVTYERCQPDENTLDG